MPLYEFRCAFCGWWREDIRCIKDREDAPKCDVCKAKMNLVVSPVRGIVKDPAVPRKTT